MCFLKLQMLQNSQNVTLAVEDFHRTIGIRSHKLVNLTLFLAYITKSYKNGIHFHIDFVQRTMAELVPSKILYCSQCRTRPISWRISVSMERGGGSWKCVTSTQVVPNYFLCTDWWHSQQGKVLIINEWTKKIWPSMQMRSLYRPWMSFWDNDSLQTCDWSA